MKKFKYVNYYISSLFNSIFEKHIDKNLYAYLSDNIDIGTNNQFFIGNFPLSDFITIY